MKKGICLYAVFVLLACGGFYYALCTSTETQTAALLQTQTTQIAKAAQPQEQKTQIVTTLEPEEHLLQASIRFEGREEALVIVCQDEEYRLTSPVECEISAQAFERYIGAIFTLNAQERLNVESTAAYLAAQETSVTLKTNLRTISLSASQPMEGECIVVLVDEGAVYRVKKQDVSWRGASVPTLTGQLFYDRQTQEVDVLNIDAADGAYHFTRTQDGVELDGKQADLGSFENVLEKLFTLPLEFEPSASAKKDEETIHITLSYTDGNSDTLCVAFKEETAYLYTEEGAAFMTDAWRVHALMIACDGARMVDGIF